MLSWQSSLMQVTVWLFQFMNGLLDWCTNCTNVMMSIFVLLHVNKTEYIFSISLSLPHTFILDSNSIDGDLEWYFID